MASAFTAQDNASNNTELASGTTAALPPVPIPTAIPSTQLDLVDTETLGSEVLGRLAPELQALDAEDLITINVDVPSAVTTVLGVLPELRTYRKTIIETIPGFDLSPLDKLEDYALVLNIAQGRYLSATRPSAELAKLVEEATTLRETLLLDAKALAHRKAFDPKRLDELKGVNGHRNLATDLNILSQVLKGAFASFEGRSWVTQSELNRAERLQQRMLRLIGERENGTPMVAEITELRQRAFTLFVNAYDDVRRAISFLRWKEGDIDDIAPSLYAGRTTPKGRKNQDKEPQAETPHPVDAGVATAPSGGGASTAGNAAQPSPAAAGSAQPANSPHPFLNQ